MATASVPPLDILMLAPVALPGEHGIGGIQRIVSRQARWLAGRGHRVRVVTSAHPSGVQTLTDRGVEYRFLDLDKGLGRTTGHTRFTVARWRAATLDAWPSLLADGVPDVVHGHAEAELGLVAAGLIGRGRLGDGSVVRTAAVLDRGRLAGVRPLPSVSTLYGSTWAGILDHLRLTGRAQSGLTGRAQSGLTGRAQSGLTGRAQSGDGATTPGQRAVRLARATRGALGVVPTFGSARWLRRTHVIALSARHQRMVRLSYGLKNVMVVAPGVDTVLYHPPSREVREIFRARHLIGPDAFTWAVVGRVAVGKGVDVAIAALARLAAGSGEPDRLLIAGTGPAEPALREQAASLGVDGRVTWAGDFQPPAVAYMCADTLLFPTGHEESFGLVALEAMSCGLPVVASARGAVPELLDAAGVLVPSRDPGAWAAAMTRVRSDKAARDAWATAGRLHAVQAHSRLRTVATLEHFYGEVINRGGPR